ncbi:AAA family ATPase [Anoxybacteroides tepidamans]|uniref:AAA family ATPase n=1 Tax=Anoxybacteroides tepidamans TaxID=265948 RepID=UPI0004838E98|nr:AAA family ATPase [Anoxybacillus tepidamans]
MKPIRLTIAGLHSFREKQTIEFEKLCDGGLFGIFGPTGSGKSSILDAMTLALYGNVERAANNTHGIMNHAEKELAVSFTFELVNANGRKRYTVERSFKRSDELRVKTAISRLIEDGEERVVLADKTRDVDEQIKRLLGLEMKDFTRAVVLPQGKFAEFLSLKGVERRQMLQRLFNLEQYGDCLNKKLKAKLAKTTARLEAIRAEQAGLGDASKETLDEHKRQLAMLESELKQQKLRFSQISERYERYKQLWQWKKEKEYVKQQLELCRQEEEVVAQLERKQKKAEEAERLFPYLQQYEQAKQEAEKWANGIGQIEQQFQMVRQQYEAATEEYRLIRERKNEEEPKRLQKKEQLIQARQLLERIEQIKQELTDIARQIDHAITEEERAKRSFQQLSDLYERALEKQKRLKEEWQQKQVNLQTKERIYRAYEEKRDIQTLEQALQEIKEQWQAKQAKLDEISRIEKVYEEQEELIKTKWAKHFQQLQWLYHYVCEQQGKLEKTIVKIKEKQKVAEQERMRHAALALAAELKDGIPCPVCGSLHHPDPLKSADSDTSEPSAEWADWLEQAQMLVQPFQSLKIQLEQLAEAMMQEDDESLPTLENVEKLKKEVERELPSSIHEQLHYFSAEAKALHQDYLQYREETNSIIQKRRKIEKEKQDLFQQRTVLQQEIDEWMSKYHERAQAMEERMKAWLDAHDDLPFEAIEQLMKQLRENERESQLLQERIEKSVRFLEEKAFEREKAKEEWQQLERKRTEYSALLQMKQQQHKEYEQALPFAIQSVELERLLAETEEKLRQLQQEEEAAYKKWNDMQKQYQMLEAKKQAAQLALSESHKRFEQMSTQWVEQLQKSAFATGDEVRAALLNEKEKTIIANQVAQYREKRLKWQNEWERITKMMNGEDIAEEQWLEIERLRQEEEEKTTELIKQVASMRTKLEELIDKHARFQELEQQRVEAERLANQYRELQNVLRGNGFVEFIAEEQLIRVTRDASQRLGTLTRQRYAIEVDSEGGFIIRDDANGGVRRPVTTLSGGETFLTSLSLALALSAQIQLRGEYPLQFFFLDEGFGTLDGELLDVVISALERLQSNNMAIGVISHVQELRARLPKRLIVEPAEPSGRGTRVMLEVM